MTYFDAIINVTDETNVIYFVCVKSREMNKIKKIARNNQIGVTILLPQSVRLESIQTKPST